MAEALASLSPDVIVLTEYVEGLYHKKFVSDLEMQGFAHAMTSPITPQENQVFIASRTALEKGVTPELPIEKALTSNVLHVNIPDKNIEVLGLRMPSFKTNDPEREKKRNDIWDWITATARIKEERPLIILGDFNTGPKDTGTSGGKRFDQLVREGWSHALPLGSSWWSQNKENGGRQIDHALLSKHFVVRNTEYIPERGQYIFAQKPGAMSDHAILLVDADLK